MSPIMSSWTRCHLAMSRFVTIASILSPSVVYSDSIYSRAATSSACSAPTTKGRVSLLTRHLHISCGVIPGQLLRGPYLPAVGILISGDSLIALPWCHHLPCHSWPSEGLRGSQVTNRLSSKPLVGTCEITHGVLRDLHRLMRLMCPWLWCKQVTQLSVPLYLTPAAWDRVTVALFWQNQ